MKTIRSPEEAISLPDGTIKQRIQAELAGLLTSFPGVYDPAAHGWFLLVETPDDLTRPVCPSSPITPLQVIQDRLFEWLDNGGDHYALAWIIDGSEAVTIYLTSAAVADSPDLQTLLNEQAWTGA